PWAASSQRQRSRGRHRSLTRRYLLRIRRRGSSTAALSLGSWLSFEDVSYCPVILSFGAAAVKSITFVEITRPWGFCEQSNQVESAAVQSTMVRTRSRLFSEGR